MRERLTIIRRRLVILAELVTLMLLVLTSCSQESIPQEQQEPQAIGFSARFADSKGAAKARMTRAPGDGELTTELLRETGFGVYCWYTGSTLYVPGNPIKNYTTTILMMNQQVEYKNSKWTYTPSKYWPINKDEMLTLRAYAPYVSYALQTDANGLPLLPVVVDSMDFQNGTQHDPLWGTSKLGGSEGTTYGLLYNNLTYVQSGSETTADNRDGIIDWYFHHGMTRLILRCALIPEPGCDSVVIQNINVTPLYDKGLLSLSSATTSESEKPTWTERSSNNPEGMTVDIDAEYLYATPMSIKAGAEEPDTLLNKGLLIIPRNYKAPNIPLTVTITYTVDNDATPLTATGTIDNMELFGNTTYTLNLSLTPSTKGLKITLVQSAFTAWQSGGTGTHTVYNW